MSTLALPRNPLARASTRADRYLREPGPVCDSYADGYAAGKARRACDPPPRRDRLAWLAGYNDGAQVRAQQQGRTS